MVSMVDRLAAFCKKTIFIPLILAGLTVWACITWPLPRYFDSAVAFSGRDPDTAHVSVVNGLVPGDHIQLLYHFWLCGDMLAGKTPAFSNVYEFNTGDDAARKKFEPYYVPFSLVFAFFAALFGNAVGWNAAGLFSVFLGIFGSYYLARRFTSSLLLAFLLAAVSVTFPYRWITLLGGSPTGFAIGIAPWLFYGLDRAVRDKSKTGAVIAGIAVLFSYCSDLHLFYFSLLVAPFWCVFSWLAVPVSVVPSWRRLRDVAIALLPFAVIAGAAVMLGVMSSNNLGGSTMSDGRTLNELRLFSPIKKGLFSWSLYGIANHIFFGTALAVFLAFGAVGSLTNYSFCDGGEQRRLHLRRIMLAAIIGVVICAVVALSFGTHGPADALPVKLARKLIPKYTMIRQPMKIFCILSPFVTVFAAIVYAPFFERVEVRELKCRCAVAVAVLFGIAAALEHILWFSPTLCVLPSKIFAYKAAAENANSAGIDKPRAVVIPLWPGDSHWSSVYEYGVIGSRVRMLNGYAPSVPSDYFSGVFSKLDSLNGGYIMPEQVAFLRTMGINYVIFHEQPYPTKVSPFPSAVALRRLRSNPYLRLVATEDAVWVFAIHREAEDAVADYSADEPASLYPASIQWYAERLSGVGLTASTVTNFPLRLRAPVPPAPEMRYSMLVSGGGTLRSPSGEEVQVPVGTNWITAPFCYPQGENWFVADGNPEMHHALVMAGTPDRIEPNDEIIWPAGQLFHSGISDPETGAVLFKAGRNRGVVLYGPDLPYPAGEYRISLVTSSAGYEGTIGNLTVSPLGAVSCVKTVTVASTGVTTVDLYQHDGLLPLHIGFDYNSAADVTVVSVILRRLH